MKNVVLDTDIFVDFLRGFEKAKNFFEKIKEEADVIYFSAVTESELISGKECNKIERRAEILEILSNFTKVSVVNQIAVKAGDFTRIYNIEIPDSIIAATAFVMKAELITRNTKDFEKIREIKIRAPY